MFAKRLEASFRQGVVLSSCFFPLQATGSAALGRVLIS